MLKAGVYTDISAAAYFADPCPEPSLTQSIAKILIDRSPAHARLAHPRLNPAREEPREYDRALAIGNAAHRILIGRGKDVCVIEADSFRGRDAISWRNEAIARGSTPILQKHSQEAVDLVLAVRDQLDAVGLVDAFRSGNGEVAIICEDDGIWLRAMVDWVETDALICTDLKTSGLSASPYSVPQVMASAGWPIQAAMQERILEALDPRPAHRKFRFVMVENKPPYALTVNELSEAVMTIGRKQLDYAMRIWRRCVESGSWPAYPATIFTPDYPGYKEAAWLNRELSEFDSAVRTRAPMLTNLMGG